MKHKNEQENTQEIERQKLQELEMQEFVSGFSSRKGKDKAKEVTKWVGTGVFMGASDAIPGYSGGTTLALIGFFKKLVIVARSVFVPMYGITRRRAMIFMIPFIAGWMAGVFGVAKATEALASHGMGLELMFFFFAFVLAAIPVYIRSIKRTKGSVKRKYPKWVSISIALFGFAIVLTLALVTLLVKGGAPFHGNKNSGDEKFDIGQWWYLAIVAYVAGLVTIVPGGSGAIIQLLSGMYDKIHWRIMAHADQNLLPLFMFALFTFLGMLTMVFILSWFLKKYERILELFSLGMLLAAPAAILIVPEIALWDHLHDWKHIIGIISASILGASFGLVINLYTRKKVTA